MNTSENQDDVEILRLLQDMGMTESEARVYKFVVENSGGTTRDILRTLSLRQPQLYDITSSLERKGFINVLEGRPKRYEPLGAEIIFREREEALSKNREIFLKWASGHGHDEHLERPAIWMSRNWKSFKTNCLEIIGHSKRLILFHTTMENLENFMDVLREKQRSGVRILLMLFNDDIQEKRLAEIAKSGIFSDIRVLNMGQSMTLIGDEFLSTFMPRNVLMKENVEKYGYIFRDRDMTWFLTHHFFVGWFSANTVINPVLKPPLTYSIQRMALSDMQFLFQSGFRTVRLNVKGIYRSNGKSLTANGVVSSINVDHDTVNFVMKTDEGKDLVVGGYDSKIEDLQASEIMITEISR